MSARPTPSPELLADLREMAEKGLLYPAAFGALRADIGANARAVAVVRRARETIAAVDMILAERKAR